MYQTHDLPEALEAAGGHVRPFWDQQTAIEAASVWGELCNECHGGRRKLEDAIKMPPPPADWGRGTGLFFGQRRPYQELFGVVLNGGPIRNGQKSEMPAWQGRISSEEIWAILYFLEFQSGGIEGRFPAQPVPAGQRRPLIGGHFDHPWGERKSPLRCEIVYVT